MTPYNLEICESLIPKIKIFIEQNLIDYLERPLNRKETKESYLYILKELENEK